MRLNNLYIMDARDCLPQLDSNSIKMIYIDPPYNTQSKQFEYHDHHDNWHELIEPLLQQSKRILREDGVIFISIDDNKMVDIRLLGDKVFGAPHFLGMFITRQATRSNAKHINTIHEYIIAYAKNKKRCPAFEMKRVEMPQYRDDILRLSKEIKSLFQKQGIAAAQAQLKKRLDNYAHREEFSWLRNYSIVDDNGEICFAKDLSTPSDPHELHIPEIGLHLPALKTRGWSSREKLIALHREHKLLFKDGRPYEKHLLKDSKDSAMSILNFYSRQGKHDLDKLGMGHMFKTAKPVELIKYLIKIATQPNDIVLDFFAGSGTTAQAVIECNLEDGGARKFILCQIAEPIKNNPAAVDTLLKYGFSGSIADIARLRLEKIKQYYHLSNDFSVLHQQKGLFDFQTA